MFDVTLLLFYNNQKPAVSVPKFWRRISMKGFSKGGALKFAPPPQRACTQIFAPPP